MWIHSPPCPRAPAHPARAAARERPRFRARRRRRGYPSAAPIGTMSGMPLITLIDAHLALGDRPLLDGAQLTVRSGERLGLIGRNGTGKSTLLRILAGVGSLDDGERRARDGMRIAFVEQEPELPEAPTLRESLLERARSAAATSAFAQAELSGSERERW